MPSPIPQSSPPGLQGKSWSKPGSSGPPSEIIKIVIIGPESTGKSTLCADLSEALCVPWVPEYARQYLEILHRPYEEADLQKIAAGQLREEDRIAASATRLLLCDTDLHVLKTWSEERYGRCHRRILEAIATRRYHAYLLTYPDLPWIPDPQREHPNPADRLRLWHQYHDTVQATGLPWADIRGGALHRIQTASNFIHRTFANIQSKPTTSVQQ